MIGDSASSDLGGLVGNSYGIVAASYSTGSVTGGQGSVHIGGLIGGNTGEVNTSYSTGAVTSGSGSLMVGGLTGEGGTINTSYSTGSVTSGSGSSWIGGLAGVSDATISMSYSTGLVSVGPNSTKSGGFVGENDSVLICYWDSQTSGWATDGLGSLATSETTSLMKIQSTFVGWDFDSTWIMLPDSFPKLRVFQTLTWPTQVVLAAKSLTSNANASYTNCSLSFSNLQGKVDVFNIRGTRVASFNANGEGSYALNISAGVYVLRGAGLSMKFAVGAR